MGGGYILVPSQPWEFTIISIQSTLALQKEMQPGPQVLLGKWHIHFPPEHKTYPCVWMDDPNALKIRQGADTH